jgi:Uma2 family endonuclease
MRGFKTCPPLRCASSRGREGITRNLPDLPDLPDLPCYATSMRPAHRRHRYTYADYVAVERESQTKHEFLDGEIYAMAGGSEEHSALAAEVLRALGNAVGTRPCRVHTSDLRIYVEAVGLATFPDGSVICGSLEQHPPSPAATALNPTVLLEVTSDSSEEYDLVTKLESYRSIPSLRDYIIVSHRERRITVHSRVGGGWSPRIAKAGGRVGVSALDVALMVDDVYRASSIQ